LYKNYKEEKFMKKTVLREHVYYLLYV